MDNDRDRVRKALAEHQEQQAQIARERRLMELIEEFQASPFMLLVLAGVLFVLLLFIFAPWRS